VQNGELENGKDNTNEFAFSTISLFCCPTNKLNDWLNVIQSITDCFSEQKRINGALPEKQQKRPGHDQVYFPVRSG
jgi:hypothetical protein